MHELIAYAKSPLDLVAYDNSVSYNFPSIHRRENECEPVADTSVPQSELESNSVPGTCVYFIRRCIAQSK